MFDAHVFDTYNVVHVWFACGLQETQVVVCTIAHSNEYWLNLENEYSERTGKSTRMQRDYYKKFHFLNFSFINSFDMLYLSRSGDIVIAFSGYDHPISTLFEHAHDRMSYYYHIKIFLNCLSQCDLAKLSCRD